MTATPKPSDAQFIEDARSLYHKEGEIRIDDKAKVSRNDIGAYVEAWVWVEDSETSANWVCPKCRSVQLRVLVNAWAKLQQYSEEDFQADFEGDCTWETESPMMCEECDFSATAGDFEVLCEEQPHERL